MRSNTHFLYHLIARLCIGHSKDNENNKTILIDGGGNNLGYLYIDLTKITVKETIQYESSIK